MSCSPFDLRDYYLQELTEPEQRQVDDHIKDCPACRQEMEQLRLTQAALFSLREEEIPQRIAFVSDPVFEPSRARRWMAGLWASTARLGFAAALLLCAAVLFSSLTRTAGPRLASSVSLADVDQRIQTAVAQSEARQAQKTTQLVHELVQRVDTEKNLRVIAEAQAEYLQKQTYAMERSNGAYVTKASLQGEFK